ncbi:hypothetical protein [Oceanimonas baumannii]|uniref:Pathogenicity locus n=2 Tax=Oceanimonas baumannii TaxID=129578 RepID=A0A235CBL5_9GAMM|nr:hypothetical protein [Oceanimonas baumannii]OYD21195.1 hypothetical protein B6S09_16840 [Oceanimonas baumannii]TDW55305.1 hypothetical protein LY04_03411 [Oceanimonas baumannii]
MAFSDDEKTALLAVKGVGPTVLKRLEDIGLDSFSALAVCQAEEIVERVAFMLHTTCWKNSPQARKAIEAAISRAQQGLS